MNANPATELLKPGSTGGFISSQAPSALPPGFMAALSNVRLTDGTVRARWGDVSIKSGLTGTIRGAYEATLDGVRYLYRAYGDGSKVTVEQSADDGTTWASITPSSGAYGDTRLTDSTSSPIRLCVIRDRPYEGVTAYDTLIIQNGIDSPRVYAHKNEWCPVVGSVTFPCADITQPEAPRITPDLFAKASTGNYFDIGGGSTTTSGTGITASDYTLRSTAPSYALQAVIDSGYVAGQVARFVISPTVDWTGVENWVAVVSAFSTSGGVDTADNGLWNSAKIQVGTSAGDITVWDPGGTSDLVQVSTNDDATLQIGGAVGANTLPINIAALDRIKISWLDTGYPTGADTVTLRVYIMAAQGTTPGGSLFGLAFHGSDFRTTGPGAVIPNQTTATFFDIGGSSPPSKTWLLVDDERFSYEYQVEAAAITTAQRDAGIDRALLFIKLVGQTDYYYCGSNQVSRWTAGGGGVWTDLPSGYDLSDAVSTEQDLTKPLPPADTVCMPVGTAMTAANGRSFVGGANDAVPASTQPIQRLWFSDYELPFAFRKAVSFLDATTANELSGGSFALDGETIMAIVPLGSFAGAAEDLSTPIAGSTTLQILTDRNLYQLSGFSATSLSRKVQVAALGTLSPLSVGRNRTGMYWLDNEGEVAKWSPSGLSRPSVNRVDNITTVIPASRKAWVTGACANDRYYMGYSVPAGTTNTACLVWNERLNSWESVDTVSAGSFEFLVPFYASGYVKLLRFGTTTLYEHEQPTSTANVLFSITFPEQGKFGKRIEVTEMAVALDSTPSVPISLTTRRTFTDTNVNKDGTISYTPTGYRAWVLDNVGAGGQGYTCLPSLFGTVPGGTRFYSVTLQIRETPLSASR